MTVLTALDESKLIADIGMLFDEGYGTDERKADFTSKETDGRGYGIGSQDQQARA